MEQNSSPEHIHKTVREEFTRWIGARRPASSLTLKCGEEPDDKTYIWTYEDAKGMEEHLVVELHNRMFAKWVVLYGDVANIVSKLLKSHRGRQERLDLPKASGSDC